MTQIHILYGRSSVTDDDHARAIAAADAVFLAAGTTAEDAVAVFLTQLVEFDGDSDMMTGLARVWVDADTAADRALTTGWHDPDGAACRLALASKA